MNEFPANKNNKKDVVDGNSTQFFQSKEKDNVIEYLSQRAKKLAAVVYIVTNLIPQNDPLRLFARKFSIKLLSLIKVSKAGILLEEVSAESADLCKKIVEMMEIAFFSGYISEMNYSILKTEFDIFTNEILNCGGFQQTIAKDSLKAQSVPDTMSFSESTTSKGQKIAYLGLKSQVLGEKMDTKELEKSRVGEGIDRSRIAPLGSVVEAKKNSRKEAIISIIKLKGSVGIRDISSVVVNCSEKTIQRELMSLVLEGTLKKAGERRWSVYSLAG